MRRIDSEFFSRSVGIDGLLTFFLSNIVLLMTLGIAFFWLLVRIIQCAKSSATKASDSSTVAIITGYLLNRQDQPKQKYKQRLDRAFDYLSQRENRRIVILGGKTGTGEVSEASVGREYLTQKGIKLNRIGIEEESQHTLENLFNLRKKLVKTDTAVTMTLITSRYHMGRTMAMASGLGLNMQPLAAEDKLILTPGMLLALLKEAYLLHWYYVGTIWSRLTRNKKSLDRIT